MSPWNGNLYTRAYADAREPYHRAACAAFDVLADAYGIPRSLIDVGCGAGHLLRHAKARRVPHAVGVDLPVYASSEPVIVGADLRAPFRWLPPRFDWVVCWEVAEHLPEADAATLVETCTRLAAPHGWIFWSAAQPGQGGIGHLNEQPLEYWIGQFARHRWEPEPIPALRERLRPVVTAAPWYAENLIIFRHARPQIGVTP